MLKSALVGAFPLLMERSRLPGGQRSWFMVEVCRRFGLLL